MTIREARERAEEKAGKRLTDEEYMEILAYTMHKAMVNGKGSDYVPLLLMDEIGNHFVRDAINRRSFLNREIRKALMEDEAMQGIVMALQMMGGNTGVQAH